MKNKSKIISDFCDTYGEGLYHITNKKPPTSIFGKIFKRFITSSYGWLKVDWNNDKSRYEVMWTSNEDYHYKLSDNRCCLLHICNETIGIVGYHVLSWWNAYDDKRDYYINFIEQRCKMYMDNNDD